MRHRDSLFWALFGLSSIALVYVAWRKLAPISLEEVAGFTTGAACVWLLARQNIWNWPVGIANNIFFIILFFNAKLYADMSLQFVYIVLAIIGWWWWLRGDGKGSTLPVRHAPTLLLALLLPIVALGTVLLMVALQRLGGAAPLWDSMTTVLSLTAQGLLTKKIIENWYIWILADIIYIGLYIDRQLYLTAVLYAVFLVMCIIGLREWRRAHFDPLPGRDVELSTG